MAVSQIDPGSREVAAVESPDFLAGSSIYLPKQGGFGGINVRKYTHSLPPPRLHHLESRPKTAVKRLKGCG